ncbi:uncharacterized protein BCR38DRAFT_447291 [Pseudomassariella vexata]|uniref:Uncharacterized protein n=1 Tax=Pseudomassariella vexata TaxID=1141098 RepID=A0A1Y2DGN4_9PEZI|nr:uncharacterized protein BCR38DRAFT_447291 [Pseudomassariella vexata]ORY58432.1 hypothetical protein BCR38DRAFT_447291 [Pseudomassariella vexata]
MFTTKLVVNYQVKAPRVALQNIDLGKMTLSNSISPCQSVKSKGEIPQLESNSGEGPEHDDFWVKPRTPEETDDQRVTRVTTNIRISLKGPSPALEQDSEEFKKQGKEIQKDIRRLSRYCRKHSRRKSSPVRFADEQRQAAEQLEQECEFRRRLSVQDGVAFLEDFLHHHFPEHLDHIRIQSTLTLEDIKMIGNEEAAKGIRECRRLFNAPVISDEIGTLLWNELRQGDALDHSHEWRSEDEVDKENIPLAEIRQQRATILAEQKAKFMANALQEQLACRGVGPSNGQGRTPPRRSRDVSPTRIVAATTAVQQHDESSSTAVMDKKAVEGFLDEVKDRTAKAAGYFAASLASGYCH